MCIYDMVRELSLRGAGTVLLLVEILRRVFTPRRKGLACALSPQPC